jgi:PTH1 family peptidyl-tRNA hydrolase
LHLIAGLGNPGRAYEQTRHNVGFMLADMLADAHGIGFSRMEGCLAGTGAISGRDVVIAKPMAYMNRSGDAIDALRSEFSIPVESILVLYDDIDLPLGRIRLRRDGGSGGHRGVESIIERLGSRLFPRLRLGIGRPSQADAKDFVLSRFKEEETPILDEMLKRGAECVEGLIEKGIDYAMNRFNPGS